MNDLKSGSNLEKVLKAGHFAFTGECGPPKGANVAHLKEKIGHLKGVVDAVNVTDNQTAVVRMSSWAASTIMVQEGVEPNFQMVCRDRNRLAMMSDILGIYAMGVRNMLCLSGDHQRFGNHPEAKNVYDIDSIQLIALVKKMRDEGKFLNDEEIDVPPRIFVGAAANPFAEPFEFRVHRLALKIAAGADFIQTQCIYNMDTFPYVHETGRGSRPARKMLHPCRGNPHEERRYGPVHVQTGAGNGRAGIGHRPSQGCGKRKGRRRRNQVCHRADR